MAEMLSPGVFVTEIDASTIVPTVSNSVAVFCGNFVKGPVDTYTLITSVDDLISYYGKPTNANYNDWYQAYNFLQYGNKLLVSRAANISGTSTPISGCTFTSVDTLSTTTNVYSETSTSVSSGSVQGDTVVSVDSVLGLSAGVNISFSDNGEIYEIASISGNDITLTSILLSDVTLGDTVYIVTENIDTVEDRSVVTVSSVANLTVNGFITFGEDTEFYQVISIDSDLQQIQLDRAINEDIEASFTVNDWIQCTNGLFEATDVTNVTATMVNGISYDIPNDSLTDDTDYVANMMIIENFSEYESKEQSIAFSAPTKSKLKIIAQNPGEWSKDLEICIAKPESFLANAIDPTSHVSRFAFEGIGLDELFEYAPTGTEVGVIVKYGDEIVEVYRVDFNPGAKDHNNKSTYIETVINNNSFYIFVKDNTSNEDEIADYSLLYDETNSEYVGKTIKLVYGMDSAIQQDDLMNAYDVFNNKEEIDIDIVIANELDAGVSAKNLADLRKDCIGFIGANYGDVVGKKSATAISNLITWRKSGALNYNNMFVVACGNYKYQYDRYNDKYRWINLAGDIAGLRAETSMNRASWWASAGLERGQIKNVIKLAFNPTQGQRDMLYKNGINPICSFPGQGTVMWGQKTLLDKPSSFDRVNVRGLFFF